MPPKSRGSNRPRGKPKTIKTIPQTRMVNNHVNRLMGEAFFKEWQEAATTMDGLEILTSHCQTNGGMPETELWSRALNALALLYHHNEGWRNNTAFSLPFEWRTDAIKIMLDKLATTAHQEVHLKLPVTDLCAVTANTCTNSSQEHLVLDSGVSIPNILIEDREGPGNSRTSTPPGMLSAKQVVFGSITFNQDVQGTPTKPLPLATDNSIWSSMLTDDSTPLFTFRPNDEITTAKGIPLTIVAPLPREEPQMEDATDSQMKGKAQPPTSVIHPLWSSYQAIFEKSVDNAIQSNYRDAGTTGTSITTKIAQI